MLAQDLVSKSGGANTGILWFSMKVKTKGAPVVCFSRSMKANTSFMQVFRYGTFPFRGAGSRGCRTREASPDSIISAQHSWGIDLNIWLEQMVDDVQHHRTVGRRQSRKTENRRTIHDILPMCPVVDSQFDQTERRPSDVANAYITRRPTFHKALARLVIR